MSHSCQVAGKQEMTLLNFESMSQNCLWCAGELRVGFPTACWLHPVTYYACCSCLYLPQDGAGLLCQLSWTQEGSVTSLFWLSAKAGESDWYYWYEGQSYFWSLPKLCFGSRTLSLQLLKEALETKGYVPIQIKQKSLKSFLKSSSASQLGLRGIMWPTEGNLLRSYRSHSPKSVITLLALQMERLNHGETTYRKSCPLWKSVVQYPMFTRRSHSFAGARGCRFSWKPQCFWMTFSSPPTESAFYLPIGMQSNRTPCEFYLSPNLLYRCLSCQTGLEVLAADICGVVSGLSGRNLGGRVLLVRFQFESHTANRILETLQQGIPFVTDSESSPLLVWLCGWMVLLCGARITGNCLHQTTFPLQAACLHSLCKQLPFPLFPAWHFQGWELIWKYSVWSDGICCSSS